jgi:hypothetical protein
MVLILTKASEAARDEIDRIAVQALNEPTKIGDYWHSLVADPEHINALPYGLLTF